MTCSLKVLVNDEVDPGLVQVPLYTQDEHRDAEVDKDGGVAAAVAADTLVKPRHRRGPSRLHAHLGDVNDRVPIFVRDIEDDARPDCSRELVTKDTAVGLLRDA